MTTTWLFYVGFVPWREDVVLSQPLLRGSIEAFRAALYAHEATVRSNEVVLEVELHARGETHSEAADRAHEAIERALGEARLSDLFRFDSFMTGMSRRHSGWPGPPSIETCQAPQPTSRLEALGRPVIDLARPDPNG